MTVTKEIETWYITDRKVSNNKGQTKSDRAVENTTIRYQRSFGTKNLANIALIKYTYVLEIGWWICWLDQSGKSRLDRWRNCNRSTLYIHNTSLTVTKTSYINDVAGIEGWYHFAHHTNDNPNEDRLLCVSGLGYTWKWIKKRIKDSGVESSS